LFQVAFSLEVGVRRCASFGLLDADFSWRSFPQLDPAELDCREHSLFNLADTRAGLHARLLDASFFGRLFSSTSARTCWTPNLIGMSFCSISLTASSCSVLVAGRYPLSEISCSCIRLHRGLLFEFLRADFLYLPRRRDCREPFVLTFTGYPS
jgi:hypothetical protein